MPESLDLLLLRLWSLWGTVVKSILLSMLIILAYFTDRFAFWTACALRYVEEWQPSRPAIFTGVLDKTFD